MDPVDCRLLCVTDRRFWRRSIGSEQRIASLLGHLARRGHPLVVAYPGRLGAAERAAVERFARDLPGFDFRARRSGWRDVADFVTAPFARMIRPGTNPLLGGASPARRRFVRTLLRTTAPRVVMVQMTRLTPLVHPRPSGVGHEPTYLLDAHDLLARRASRARAVGAEPAVDVEEEDELAVFATYDAVIAIQPVEAEAIRAKLAPRPVLVVPHGLALPPSIAHRPSGARPIRLGFLAGRDAANADALHWFLDRVWPALFARAASRVELVVGGRIGEEFRRSERGVRNVGPIAAIDEFWPAIDVAINPVRFGSGLKIKNVEALAFGRPLVTTRIGAEGLEAAVPSGVCVADTPEDWVGALEAFLDAPERIEAMGRAGRHQAERQFSESAAFAELDAFLDALAPSVSCDGTSGKERPASRSSSMPAPRAASNA